MFPPAASLRLLGRWALVVRKTWTLTDTRWLLATIVFLLAFGIAESAFTLSHPCLLSSEIHSESCRPHMILAMVTTWIKIVVTAIPLDSLHGPISSAAMAIQLGRKSDSGAWKHAMGKGWAPASSREIFHDITKVTRQSQLGLVLFVAFSCIMVPVALIPGDMASWRSDEGKEYLASTCGDCSDWWEPCCLGWKFKDTCMYLCTAVWMYEGGVTVMLKVQMWGPVVAIAAKKTKTKWLERCLWVHWHDPPLTIVAVTLMILYTRIKLMAATAGEMTAYLYLALIMSVWIFGLVCWSSDLDGLVYRQAAKALASRRRSSRREAAAERTRPSQLLLAAAPTESPVGRPGSIKRMKTAAWGTVEHSIRGLSNFKHTQSSVAPGFKGRQLQLLVTTVPLVTSTPLGSWWTLAVVWALRLLYVMLILSTKDEPCTMEELKRSAVPGFGLLIDAAHLQAAIRAYLEGGTYTGPLLMTRASFFRMDDTLSVSYRWKREEASICEGLKLNMSRWQLHELDNALSTSRCLYVWIDRLAVPQEPCNLQSTLLARMMAVYAQSKLTLCLRAVESDGDRYHQRAWTLQEYCNARDLSVVTEPSAEASLQQGLVAVAEEEEEEFPAIRQWQLTRGQICRPYWLYGFQPDATGDFRRSLDLFKDLSQRLKSQHSEDKIRALYPLLFNTPCEDQGDLYELVNAVAEVSATIDQDTCNQSPSTMGSDKHVLADLALIGSFTRPSHRSRHEYGPGVVTTNNDVALIEPLPPV